MADVVWAEQLARVRSVEIYGEDAIARAQVEVQPTGAGWQVRLHDTEATCAVGGSRRGHLCGTPRPSRDGTTQCWPVYHTVWALVERGRTGWTIRQMGAYPNGRVACQPPAMSAAPQP